MNSPWISSAGLTVAGPPTATHLPDAATTLTFRKNAKEGGDLLVIGPRSRASYNQGEPAPYCAQVRIQPGRARLLLGHSMRDLADQLIPLRDLWGDAADELEQDLADCDPALLVPRLEKALLDRLVAQRRHDLSRSDVVYDATRALSTGINRKPQQVHATAKLLNVSERQLRNLFTDAVGISPKQFARIDRVRAVLSHASDKRQATLAAEVGYYDQSHMTAEFREMMGIPPSSFLAGRRPRATPCSIQKEHR